MDNLSKIFEHASEEINDKQLKNYLSGKGSEDENRLIEKQIADSEFINDAVEGLQSLNLANHTLDAFVSNLNKQLNRHLKKKKHLKEKRRINLFWIILAVIIILLTCFAIFFLIKM